ncbi:Calx-beta domain-containing protein, partial [Conexibacter stalactiti]
GPGGGGGTGGPGGSGGNAGAAGVAGGRGGPGGSGGRGGTGGAGGVGGIAEGGAIYNEGALTIVSSALRWNRAAGGQGGFDNQGGAGGWGAAGGTGGTGSGARGGDAGRPGAGGAGGSGGPAGISGDARGGAIYNAGGTLDVLDTTFTDNVARAGNSQSGWGGTGGDGGPYSYGGNGAPRGSDANGGNGGDGGDAGAPGPGSAAAGGAVYSTVPFTLDGGTTRDNAARGNEGAWGGGGFGGDAFDGGLRGRRGSPNPLPPGNPGTSSSPDFHPAPDDGTPKLEVGDVAVAEPDSGSEEARFVVTLRPPQAGPVTVDYATHDGTATAAGGDYAPRSGTLTFAPGETAKTIAVPVLHVEDEKDDRQFTLALSNESGATVAQRTGTATIASRHRVSGRLVDRKNRPLAGVTVRIDGIDPRVVTTDANGAYSARLLPATYTVAPVAPPPGQPDDGVFEPQASDDCIAVEQTCFVRLTKRRVASFAYVFKLPVRGTIRDPGGRTVAGVPVRLTGTDETGKAVDVTVSSDARGGYARLLLPGVYTVTPRAPEGAHGPISFVPGACEGTRKPAACTVTLDREPRTADFVSECEQTVSFQTSMVAKGCLIRLDARGKRYRAKGPVRINGVDFEAVRDRTPITFDTERKLVTGTDLLVWVSRGEQDKRWLAYHLGTFRQSFPGRTVRYTLALGKSAKGWNLNGTVNATLFGFPAHAPALELESTAGRTTLTLQLSTPPKDGALLDAQSGLWKAPNDKGDLRVAYPNVVRGTVALTNDNGIQTVEGSFAPSAIFSFGATSHNGVFGVSKTAFPVRGQIQLARVAVKRDFAADVWRFSGTVVSHWRPGAKGALPPLPLSILRRIGTNDNGEGFFSALVFDVELGLKFSGGGAIAAIVDRAALRANGINKVVLPFTYLQRLGIDMGRDTDAAKTPLKLQLNGGLTLGPRIRSDVWFQELLSLDVDGGLYIPSDTYDLTVAGNAVLRAANARLINGRIVWNIMGGSAEVTGESSLNLRDFIRRLPAGVGDISFLGGARLSIPAGQPWTLHGDGRVTLLGQTGAGKFRWTSDVLGVCMANGWGIVYDGGFHPTTACGFDAFGARARASAAAAATAFAVGAGREDVAIAVRGRTAAPLVTLDGPDGMRLETPGDRLGAATARTAVFRDERRKTTYVVLNAPAAGSYRIGTAAGSSAIADVRFARRATTPRVRASVRVERCRATLRWALAPRPGQRVHLFEHSSSGAREIAVVSRARGRRTFTPGAGGGPARRLTAVVEQDGAPRAQLGLGRYRVPSARVPAIRGLRATRAGRRVVVAWRPSCGARRTLVQVTGGGRTVTRLVRGSRVAVTVPRRAKAARVTAWPISATGANGRAATRTAR